MVASKLLGAKFGVLSGSALLVDYVLTISVSVAAGADATFSLLPVEWQQWKLLLEVIIIALLMMMNIRGVKESVFILAPIFILFLLTHSIVILGTVGLHVGAAREVIHEARTGFQTGIAALGFTGLLGLFLRAYSLGAGPIRELKRYLTVFRSCVSRWWRPANERCCIWQRLSR